MQENKKRFAFLKTKLKRKFKEQSKIKNIILLIVIILVLASCIITFITQLIRQIQIKQIEDKSLIEYEVKDIIDIQNYNVVIKFNSVDGLETIKYIDQNTNNEVQLNCNGRVTVGIDYIAKDQTNYEFKIKIKGKTEQTEILYFEIPRIEGNYTLVDGVYANEPDTSGYVKENTRYLYMNDKGNLEPGNWITDDKPTNWYSYNNQNWANIYVENNGVESCYVWIPRYVYKKDNNNLVAGNERMDVKFINTDNEYIDGTTGQKLTIEELLQQGYQFPEAFMWENRKEEPLIIPGYWMSKYQLSELSDYKINYSLSASKTTFNVSNFTNNVVESAAKYTYAINGQIVYESTTLEEYSFTNGTPDQNNTINITALDVNGSIVGSMTKKIKLTEANPPDLAGFDKDTTFYVYWDEDGNEHNEIPISMDPPEDWYNYTYSQWANIVTRNNGLETYLVWIPRYQYSLDQTSQRSDVKFIMGIGTDTSVGYSIPEAFTWGDNGEKQLTGYWMAKYQLSKEETTEKITAEMASGGTTIKIRDITGTLITNASTNGINIKYEYYLNGNKVHEGTSSTENYTYTGLNLNTEYTVNIIARNANTNQYIGAITDKIKTEVANEPDITGFDPDTTYYVIYDDNGNETQRVSIKDNVPDNWYDYSNRKWANIVTTANSTESYFVWIPRYEYKILEDRDNLSKDNRRTEVNFITTDITNENCTTGYKVPEAFTWGDNGEKQLTGYWMAKYQLSN